MKPPISRHLGILTILCLTLWASVQAADYTYETNNGTITITGYTGPGGAVTIPDTINGLPVTSIRGEAFEGCTSLTSVTIPNNVTSIGNRAFLFCTSLTNVTIGSGVTNIGSATFHGCTKLTSVTIPNSVTHIGEGAFNSCTSLTSVTIPDSVTSIGKWAFFGSGQATSTGLRVLTVNGSVTITKYSGHDGVVTIPDKINALPVTNIGDGAFINCTNLTSITIPNSVTNIGLGAFNWCSSLTAITVDTANPIYSSVDGILFDESRTMLVQCPGGKAGSYTIPNSVTSIGDQAFMACTNLIDVTIGNGVTNIGHYAFEYCNDLTTITIPNSVTSIGGSAFSGCESLTSITIPNSVTSIGDGAFYGCTSLTSVTIPDSLLNVGLGLLGGLGQPVSASDWRALKVNESIMITGYNRSTNVVSIPDKLNGLPVTSIGGGAFEGCTSLTSVTIPDSVTSIGGSAFSECAGLSSVTIPGSVTSIGESAFFRCTSLESVTIPDSVTSIGYEAFSYCRLTSVTIPNSVTSIGYEAFSYCRLTNVTIPNSVTSIGYAAFSSCTSLTAITVDTDNPVYISVAGVLVDKSQTTLMQYPAGKAGSQYMIPDGVTSIEGGAFSGCTSLTGVTIPNSVASIGGGAFYGCTGLKGAHFKGDAPSSVGSYIFYVRWDDHWPPWNLRFNVPVYYLAGTTGWGDTFADCPTALWLPEMQASDASFGVKTNQFGFNISWASDKVIVVEASTTLTKPSWSPVATNTLNSGSSSFSDPQWMNYPTRFYRIRSP